MSLINVNDWLVSFLKLSEKLETEDEIIVAPTFTYMPFATPYAEKAGFRLAAQDVSAEDKGAHTGETGAFQIRDFCKYGIVGHSERKEFPEFVAKKAKQCLQNDIVPIICFVDTSSLEVYKNFSDTAIFAWEDPSNISKNGVYNPKDSAEIQEGANKIRAILKKDTPVLYGGSVNRDNVEEIARISELNGVLVGNASTDPDHFFDIITKYQTQN